MVDTQTLADPLIPAPGWIEERLAKLSQGLQRAYCMAVCVERALRCNLSDDSPELAVCISEYLVRPLDGLSIEADQLRQALDAGRAQTDQPA